MRKAIKKIIPNIILQQYSKYKKQQALNLYKGDKVVCSICNSTYKVFKTYGLSKRENAECFNCGSLERHRLLWKYLDEKFNFFESNIKIKVLHFGPERIFYDVLNEKDNIEYIPCDLFPEKYLFNGKAKIEKVDITNIPFEDNTFDFILCNHVLEHIPNDKLAMSELFRVMKKGGWGIFQVPMDYNSEKTHEDFTIISPEEREKAFGQYDHVRLYGLDYKDILLNAGFNVNVDNFVKSFSSEEIFINGFMSTELIFNCSK